MLGRLNKEMIRMKLAEEGKDLNVETDDESNCIEDRIELTAEEREVFKLLHEDMSEDVIRKISQGVETDDETNAAYANEKTYSSIAC